jgi:hypothetical protein
MSYFTKRCARGFFKGKTQRVDLSVESEPAVHARQLTRRTSSPIFPASIRATIFWSAHHDHRGARTPGHCVENTGNSGPFWSMAEDSTRSFCGGYPSSFCSFAFPSPRRIVGPRSWACNSIFTTVTLFTDDGIAAFQLMRGRAVVQRTLKRTKCLVSTEKTEFVLQFLFCARLGTPTHRELFCFLIANIELSVTAF